jgi:hypothetical protein
MSRQKRRARIHRTPPAALSNEIDADMPRRLRRSHIFTCSVHDGVSKGRPAQTLFFRHFRGSEGISESPAAHESQ